MELGAIEDGEVMMVEGQPDVPFMASIDDVTRVLEACFSSGAHAAQGRRFGLFETREAAREWLRGS